MLRTTGRRSVWARLSARAVSVAAVSGLRTRSGIAPSVAARERLIHLEVRPERSGGDVGGEHDERCAGLRGLRQAGERVRKAGARWTLATPGFPLARA